MAARDSRFVRHLPNALTTLRLAAVPVFVVLLIAEDGPGLASGLVFLAAAFTDFFDGFIARRFGAMSQFGKVADPLADRLLVNLAVILLCVYDARWFGGHGRLLGPECLVVVARDLLAVVGYLQLRSLVIPSVTRSGKVGMALMMGGLTWLLLLPDATWPMWPFEAGLVVSVLVMGQYLRKYRTAFRRAAAQRSGTAAVGTPGGPHHVGADTGALSGPAPGPRVD